MLQLKPLLIQNKDDKYKKFMEKLVNSDFEVLGVRTPVLKKIVKDFSKSQTFSLDDILSFNPTCFEETTALGLLGFYKKLDFESQKKCVLHFVEVNDNWASNDLVTSEIKIKSKEWFDFLISLLNKGEWHTRFAITSMLTNFLTEKYLPTIFEHLNSLQYGEYYVDMAVAWLVSIAFIKYQDATIQFLKTCKLPKFVLQKSVSKICDSKRVDLQTKQNMKDFLKEILCKREI